MRAAALRWLRGLTTAAAGILLVAAQQSSAGSMNPATVERVASGLAAPVFVTAPPGDTGRLFIVQQGSGGSAEIRILNLQTLTLNATPFLTVTDLLTGGERGLLGMAFDPDYSVNGRFYLYVTVAGGFWNAGQSEVRQYTVSANPDVAGTAFTTVLAFDQPQSNHNGGWIGFSPRAGDKHNLYIASGDGGGANDFGTGHIEPGGNAQSTATLLGKMLRIKIDPDKGTYTIPPGNPYAGAPPPTRREIFNTGLRNPYRCAFDRVTGDLFIGDVGQSAREEISVQKAGNPGGGENFEWRLREGFIETPMAGIGGPSPPGGVPPILDYPRSVGRTVIGGYIYRGHQIPSLRGRYVFGDYLGPTGGTSTVFMMSYDGSAASEFANITGALFAGTGHTLANLSSLGEDANGELYLVDISGGAVYRIVPHTPHVETTGVERLPNGNMRVDGRGVPFKWHGVEATDTLVEQFQTIAQVLANGGGGMTFEDANVSGTDRRFYRFVYPGAIPPAAAR